MAEANETDGMDMNELAYEAIINVLQQILYTLRRIADALEQRK